MDEGGAGTLSEDVLAINMGLSVKSSGFQVKCLTARQFGLLTKQGENLTTTPIAKSIIHPTTPDDAANGLRQAFSRMPLFQAVAERYKGQPLPPGEMFRNILEREFRISRDRVADAERMLRDSAREAGVLTTSGDKEYLMVTSAPTATQIHQTPLDPIVGNASNAKGQNESGVLLDLADVRKDYAEYLLSKVKDSKDGSTDDLMDRLERVLGITRTQSAE
ncbi:MAG: hypothetical protein HYX93_06190 [Chloroflexi bacterium]|nr:hypothetical protein [Chloroflexota bacterium]